jgi:hypothetical protein
MYAILFLVKFCYCFQINLFHYGSRHIRRFYRMIGTRKHYTTRLRNELSPTAHFPRRPDILTGVLAWGAVSEW